nr:hypothetical protein [Tanacetum cinerariifolium]
MPASDIPVPADESIGTSIPLVILSDTESEISPKVEATGVEIEALRARAASAEANVAILRDVLRIAGDRITDLEFQAEDTESRLHQCERGRIQDRARIRRLEEHLGIGQ